MIPLLMLERAHFLLQHQSLRLGMRKFQEGILGMLAVDSGGKGSSFQAFLLKKMDGCTKQRDEGSNCHELSSQCTG